MLASELLGQRDEVGQGMALRTVFSMACKGLAGGHLETTAGHLQKFLRRHPDCDALMETRRVSVAIPGGDELYPTEAIAKLIQRSPAFCSTLPKPVWGCKP